MPPLVSPGEYDLVLYQGATFSRRFVWKDAEGVPFDLTGWTAHMQVRSSASSPAVVLDLSTDNGRITITGGEIALYVSAAETNDLRRGKFVYDLELTADDVVVRLLEGKFEISPQVTKLPEVVAP